MHCCLDGKGQSKANYTLTAKDPKQQVYGGLESEGLEAGGLEAGGLEAGATDFGSGAVHTCP